MKYYQKLPLFAYFLSTCNFLNRAFFSKISYNKIEQKFSLIL
ncbi:hypothetical protein LEP1GSC172_1463 [Leptospira noguchii]|uniref:Uncharacterized protein n=1 Tax=Leptospira noguchii TaxID=28182 RepID=M6VD90_9LEPT|nr:hypothetical protein LEP1GSC172_1463 [Leptospira noguchii]